MAVAHEAPAPPERNRWNWAADNPIVRAIGRVRLPLGAKLIAGFAIVAALLAIVAALGLVALGGSNSRGLKLPALRENEFYEGLLRADAENLRRAIEFRLTFSSASANQEIANDMAQLCEDAGAGNCGIGPAVRRRFTLSLAQLDPSLLQRLTAATVPIFYPLFGLQPRTGTVHSLLQRQDRFATMFEARLAELALKTEREQRSLVAANRRSFIDSRNLLIGLGAGSFSLAVALGLLLAASVVAPLRRIRDQLAAIAGGDFARHAEVANRDEIGALAADVNRMSDELQRVYRELELASEHKSQFLATMSHELRTPLNAIIGFSEVLHEQMFGELNERQLAYVQDVLEAGKHLLSLINDVLDLAKVEAGKMELELSEIALADVLRSAVSMHAERASRGGIELSLSSEPDAITVAADARRIRQIVFNLLSNAVKFTPPQGRVDISARLADGQVAIAIADTGPGIPATELETIFEEFEQTSHGKRADGTGLGLPLSRKLVELHGGRLWAESEPGHGSTFRFTLPVRQGAEA
jgi:signal transduction histidine kinase